MVGGGGGEAGGKREWQREYGHAEVGKRGCGEDGLAGRGTGEATAGRGTGSDGGKEIQTHKKGFKRTRYITTTQHAN